MTPEPPKFAETPVPAGPEQETTCVGDLDALSEVLHAIHLRGGTVVHRRARHPLTSEHPARTRAVHIIESGTADLVLDDGTACQLEAGDLVLVARGDAHRLRSEGAAAWVTGVFSVEESVADALLAVLPSTIVIRGGGPGNDWLRLSLDLLLVELSAQRPGAQVMVSRILDLLFIHALRAWADAGDASPGWLTAAMDPALGPVLSAIHRSPATPWSVDDLARRANLSRSAFAGRFAHLLGVPPAAYVTEQRLQWAATLLKSTTDPVGAIAQRVGYSSEAAFSRAFRRRYGEPPRRWRARNEDLS